jgi:sterol desaturase/sphingolipid hydroxylase (fatty acid hydroxylase superfamily)
VSPLAVGGLYAHPIEHVLCNVLPALAGPVLCGSHVTTLWYLFKVFNELRLWFTIANISVVNTHSGFDLPFHFHGTRFHDFHHERFTSCCKFIAVLILIDGVLGLCDWMHGTDTDFNARYGAGFYSILFKKEAIK